MAEFFIYSESGDGAFIGRRLQTEGHRVRLYVHGKEAQNVYNGVLPKSKTADPRRGEICIFDMVRYGPMADSLRKRGFKVIGAARFADRIEMDRPYGARVMRDVGIKVPETYVFSRLDDGINFLRSHDGHWFYKPSGNISCDSTFNAHSMFLARYLEWCKREPPQQFELQKKMEGTEISLEGWFDGTRFVWPFNSTVEDKKFLDGDKGPRTGCMSNVVWAYEDPKPTLASKTLARLAPVLETSGYVGPIDINLMIDKEGIPYGLEWSPRFGYDALQALIALIKGDLGHQLSLFVDGRLDEFSVRTDAYSLTANISVPPFPNWHHAKESVGLPLDEKILRDERIQPRDVMMGKDGKPELAGADGCVGTIGAVGTDLNLMRTEVLDLAKELHIPNAQYRSELVKRAEGVLTALSSFMYDMPAVREVEPSMRKIYQRFVDKRFEKEVEVEKKRKTGTIDMFQKLRPNTVPQEAITPVDVPTFNK